MIFNQLLYLIGCLALSLVAFFFVFVWIAIIKALLDEIVKHLSGE
ncbi:hypothetical protein ABID29_001818 [Streptococcus rupicaprae]|uniref:Uncharacterized protein n=1 Tax=Streptococcus rupicaprae TaxID=759619 RepID=A0ABV2FJI3_9STRE